MKECTFKPKLNKEYVQKPPIGIYINGLDKFYETK